MQVQDAHKKYMQYQDDRGVVNKVYWISQKQAAQCWLQSISCTFIISVGITTHYTFSAFSVQFSLATALAIQH